MRCGAREEQEASGIRKERFGDVEKASESLVLQKMCSF